MQTQPETTRRFPKSVTLFLLCIVTLYIPATCSENIYTMVNTYFVSLDSAFGAITRGVSRIQGLNPTDEHFINALNDHSEFEYLMRTNSKGKIISKASGGKAAPRTYRFIGDQTWHKTTEISKKPYYGNIIQKKGYYLFWNRPVMVKTKYGSRFGGAVAVKINLKKCFQNIASTNKIPFQIIYAKRTLFSNIKKGVPGSFSENKLAVYGMPGLVVRYPTSPAKSAVAAAEPPVKTEEKATQVTKKGAAPKVMAGEKASAFKKETKKGTKKKTTTPAAFAAKKEKDKPSGPGRIIVLLIVCAVCLCVVIFCMVALKRAADKRKKLIEAIDKGEL